MTPFDAAETPSAIGQRRIHFDITDSTNTRALEFHSGPGDHGTIFTADFQSQGRGQHGRIWESGQAKNILLTVLLYPQPAWRQPAIITGWAALSVARFVESTLGENATIKWPNDVLVHKKKIAGILVEGTQRPGQEGPVFAAGIGINVCQTVTELAALNLPHATSLQAHLGEDLSSHLASLRELFIWHLQQTYQEIDQALPTNPDHPSAVEHAWAEHFRAQGEMITVELSNGENNTGKLVSLRWHELVLEHQWHGNIRYRPEEIRHFWRL